jgi:flagellar motility protein MotE (MotC chaperone)
MTAQAPRRIRLIPMVITAATALLGLKAVEVATRTGNPMVPSAYASSAAPEPAAPVPRPTEAKPNGAFPEASDAERALLEALQKRREEIEAKAGDLELRENLMKAAEKRVEERLSELKKIEQAISDAERRREDADAAKNKELVTMYEGMKVKEAARIFSRLELGVLLGVVKGMNPRKMSDILGQMEPQAAERLTVALARGDAEPVKVVSAPVADSQLPKIEGRPAQ